MRQNDRFFPRFLRLCLGFFLFGYFPAIAAGVVGAQAKRDSFDDQDIQEAIELEFRYDQSVAAHRIDVQVDAGIVTLSGIAPTLLEQRRAKALAMTVKGVRGVVNRIKVPAGRRSDQEIRDDVVALLRDQPISELPELSVDVRGGAVVLTGEVDSLPEKLIAETEAASVRGVIAIENRIQFRRLDDRPDDEVKPEIEKRLAFNPWLLDQGIDVHVKDGRVTLMGTVSSASQKQLAAVLCWVAGVRGVDDAKLKVAWTSRQQHRRENPTVLRNDVQIKQAVQDALLYDPRTRRAAAIKVRVRQGVVALMGKVARWRAKQAAEQDAKNTLGVRRVINHLKVKQEDWPGDPKVNAHAKQALARDAILASLGLRASSHFGRLYLDGQVDSRFQKQRAETVVGNVPGVLDVVNRIRVRTPSPFKSDEEILEDVQHQIRWSVFVDAQDIKVAVDDGVVTLTGTIPGYHQKQAAEKEARQGGARRVINKLNPR